MTDTHRCPSCHAEIPADASHGLCPKCLIEAGVRAESQVTTRSEEPAAGAPIAQPEVAATRVTPPGSFTPLPIDELARRFPQLEILELVGRGGMGAVYKARQPGLDRLVALKILPYQAGQDAASTERFTREARALAKLNHPNVVSVYDFGQVGGLYYFLMEYVDG